MGPCPKCGEPTSTDHSFCLNCGAELPVPEEVVPPRSAPQAAPPAGAAPQAEQPPAHSTQLSESPRPEAPRAHTTAHPAQGSPRQQGQPPRGRNAGRGKRAHRGGDSAIPALIALVLSLALQQAMNTVVPADAYVHRLFRPQGGWIMSVVPGLIAFVFMWTLMDLVLKLRVARVNEADLARKDVNQVPAMVRQEPTATVLQRLRTWEIGLLTRPVGRRVTWVLQHLDSSDPQRAHELTRHQSDLETDTHASGYRTVRLFIWAMPILGFIGTVLGISLAVGSFSEFLTTDVSIDEIDRVTSELGNVASGLSFAFDTTLLGLLAGLVASVASTAVQAKDEAFLTGLEELGLRVMESAVSAASSGAATTAPAQAGQEFDRMMRSRLQDLSTQMQQFTSAVQSGLDGFLGEWGKLPPEVEKVAADLNGLREHLSSAAKSTEKLVLETRMLLEGLNEASTHMEGRLTTSIGSISQTVDGLGESLGGVSDTLERSLVGLTERVQASEGHLRAGMSSLQESIERSQRDDAATQGALEQLSATISDLGGTLSDFRETQSAMMPLLSQLSGPLELRLMPTPVANPRQD